MSASRPSPLTQVPGSGAVRRVARIARGRSLRAAWLAGSAASAAASIGRQPMRIRAGRHFTDSRARRLPIVVIVALGLADGAAEDLAQGVERTQLSTRSFRPLFVIDSTEFAPFRRRGYVVERVMPADELAAVNPGDDYDEYLYSRVSTIARMYRVASVVPVLPGSLDDLRGSLIRLVGTIPAKAVPSSAGSVG